MSSQSGRLIILYSHGEPRTHGFFENLGVGLRTLGHAAQVMALPLPLRWFIAGIGALRKRIHRRGGSPHNALTWQQARALADELSRRGWDAAAVHAAFSVTSPSPHALLRGRAQAVSSGAELEHPVILSMTLVDSRLACGGLCWPPHAVRGRVLARLWDDPRYFSLTRQFLLRQAPPTPGEVLVLVLHGTLVEDARGRPPDFHTGLAETEALGASVRAHLLEAAGGAVSGWTEVEIAYLNHDVGGRWTQPDLSTCLQGLHTRGVQAVAAYPLGYLVDGLETEGEMARILAASPVARTRRIPALNADPGLIRYLADRITEPDPHPERGSRCASCPRRETTKALP
jgi:protoporphyrin/coproporphyrin ferrochelatase